MSSEVRELKSELARLQRRIDAIDASGDEVVGRRGMLKTLGAAAAGATVGGLAFARPGTAADGQNVVLGKPDNTSNSPTVVRAGAPWSASPLVGAFHVTNDATQTNLNLAGSCITAIATGTGGGGHDIAFNGSGSRIGAKLDGPIPLKLTDTTNAGPPGTSGFVGQFKVDDGDLWFCTSGSLSDAVTWRRITGRDDAGMFHAVEPFRVFDSRNSGSGGPLSSGANWTLPCRDALDVQTGAVVRPNAVPNGARAITLNLAVTNTVSRGYLSVAPSTATAVGAASINWGEGTDGAINNGTLTSLGPNNLVKVFCGGRVEAMTDYIIDITGYYL